MNVDFDTSELGSLAAELGAAGPKTRRVSSEQMTKVAAQFRDDARADVAVDTGKTRDSIRVQGGKDYRTIIADSEAAFWLEFGTSDTAPQPFMWPQVPTAAQRMVEAHEELGDPFD